MQRRDFLKSAAAAVAFPAIAANAMSPNARIRVALVGLRGRGRDQIRAFYDLAKHNVEIAALVDADQNVLRERQADCEKISGKHVPALADMRRAFDDPSIDAVAFATPNHWHALGTVWACQAGKDVYVEKPGSHTIHEGRKIIEAAQKYSRIVQHGTQNRSSPNIMEGVQKLKEGVIGRVYLARGIAFKRPRPDIGRIEAGPLPAGVDWDRWLGPATQRPYSHVVHRYWRQLWEFGNGDIGNQGVHELDIIRWALDLNTHPVKVAAMGARIQQDEQQAPQVHSVMYEWPGRDLLVTFETRSGVASAEAGMGTDYPFLDNRNAVGVLFIGTEGYMTIPDHSSYCTYLGPKRTPGPSKAGEGDIANLPHFANFIQAVRSRNPNDLHAPPQDLHLSAALPHLANISYRTGRMLQFDPAAERFTNDEEANRLLTREYRAPYILPEKV